MSTLDSNTIRHLIFKAKLSDTPQKTVRICDVVAAVFELAVNEHYLDKAPALYAASEPEKAILAVIWGLIIEGVYTPGAGMEDPNLPFLHATEYGRKCFEAGELTAHDPDDYLRRLKTVCPSIDDITLLYTGEALDTFLVGKLLAATVMIGVAAENMLLRLVAAVQSALDTPERQAKFEKATMGKKAKTQHDEILSRLKSPFTPLPAEIEAVLTQQIDGIYDLIRRTRNEAGHPTGRRMERDETHALLLLFPTYCKTVHDLMEWLATNKI